MLKSYPDNSTTISKMTNVFSISKSTSTTIYFIILLFTLLALLTKYIATRNRKTTNR